MRWSIKIAGNICTLMILLAAELRGILSKIIAWYVNAKQASGNFKPKREIKRVISYFPPLIKKGIAKLSFASFDSL